MYDKPPLHDHGLYPGEILEYAVMLLIKKHFSITKNCTTDNFDKKSSDNFNEKERAIISESYLKFRNHGFYPGYIGKNGEITWLMALKSDLQVEFEKKHNA